MRNYAVLIDVTILKVKTEYCKLSVVFPLPVIIGNEESHVRNRERLTFYYLKVSLINGDDSFTMK